MKMRSIVFLAFLLPFLLTGNESDARWRDQGQSEKYFSVWEKNFQWEASAIEGYRLLLDQNYEQARQKLEHAISLGCSLGKVYFQLGLCLDKLNQSEKGIENYTRALEIFSKTKQKDDENYIFLTHHNLGVLRLEQGHDNQAVEEFEKAAQVQPNDASTHLNLGYLYSRNDMTEKAIEAYTKAISEDPHLALAHYNQGVLLRRIGRMQEGQDHLEKAQMIDPSLKGAIQKNMGSREIKDPMALSDEEVETIRANAQGAENLISVATIYLVRSRYEEALNLYDQAIALGPNSAMAQVGRGHALLYLDRMEEAQKAIFKALELDTNIPEGHIVLGKIYYDLGRIQMARQEFEKVYAQNPNNIEILFYLGVVNEYNGDQRYGKGFASGEAIQYYERVLKVNPDHLKARTNLGNVYARTGDWEKAKKEFEKASASAANSAYAHYNLGYIYDELGLKHESIEEYLKAIALDPKLADAYFNLGYVYGEYKIFHLAEKQYYKVLDIDREYADAYFNLGILYDKYLKDKSKAHTYYHEYALRRPNAAMDEKKILKKRILKLYP